MLYESDGDELVVLSVYAEERLRQARTVFLGGRRKVKDQDDRRSEGGKEKFWKGDEERRSYWRRRRDELKGRRGGGWEGRGPWWLGMARGGRRETMVGEGQEQEQDMVELRLAEIRERYHVKVLEARLRCMDEVVRLENKCKVESTR